MLITIPCLPHFHLDTNECDDKPCHSNATCLNKIGSFNCSCNKGFEGNGTHCDGEYNLRTSCNCNDNRAKIVTFNNVEISF